MFLRFTFKDPSRAPTSKIMEKARRETFGSRWPHDHIRGHGANSKKVRYVEDLSYSMSSRAQRWRKQVSCTLPIQLEMTQLSAYIVQQH